MNPKTGQQTKADLDALALDEDQARLIATAEFGIADEVKVGQKTILNPWNQDRLVTCICLERSDYDENGPAEILSRENYD